jgi:hypothetical protein
MFGTSIKYVALVYSEMPSVYRLYNLSGMMIDELEMIWKEEIGHGLIEVVSWHLPKVTEVNLRIPQSGGWCLGCDLYSSPSKYKSKEHYHYINPLGSEYVNTLQSLLKFLFLNARYCDVLNVY